MDQPGRKYVEGGGNSMTSRRSNVALAPQQAQDPNAERWPYGRLSISDTSFKYLVQQRGSLDHLRQDRRAWEDAYHDGIYKSMRGMLPHLPRRCVGILDVGAGLGGVDVLLTRYYAAEHSSVPLVVLLDGENDPPQMVRHATTFGNRKAALQFQRDNGVTNVDYVSPGQLRVRKVDLVVSTGAWCFHFGPELYLKYVLQCCSPNAVIILDVRSDKPMWLAHLLEHLNCVDIIAVEAKRTRRVFHVK